MWLVATIPEPHFNNRVELTKVIALVYVIDDIFDVFGSLEELTLFTEAVERWDISIMDSLPTYMKICYHTLESITNEISDLVCKESGWNPINSLRKLWVLLLKAFLVEAKWFSSRITPESNEYLENAVISTGVPVVLLHFFFTVCNGEGKDTIAHDLENNQIPDIISHAASILRLWDDLGTAKDDCQEGFDGSYIDYYMKEHDITLENARNETKKMISSEWKKLNRSLLLPKNGDDIKFPLSLKKAALNTARMTSIMYNYEDQRLPLLEDYARLMLLEQIS
ncbi:(3S,6E)-nerolidol synthase 2, chloroplastic/mitochondrial [Apostasia shenzhenica]|uniref:(3S,6E)-nerolidol synthase 2, chloroplastic/mitochondrial n=1 Tax=Apostasia shenzhenica TaxID=1088818 RepID=A0A2I0ADH9_9ASPA|nr:(3S,6E)-nerolidol synthase 2, chloroplastic/mitochondrial [Apostasia shenzhenica]